MSEELMPRKNAENTRGQGFKRGNPGRPRGSRNKTTLAVEALLDGEAETLTRKVVELAKSGDTTALKICFDRIAPVRKDRTVEIDLPSLIEGFNLSHCVSVVISAAADGRITTGEAQNFIRMLMIRDELDKRNNSTSESTKVRDMTSEERRQKLGQILREGLRGV
jgi:hypothetical protein